MSFTTQEINSQPALWLEAASLPTDVLPKPGESVAVVGCGTSWFIAQSYTAKREAAGLGVSDAFTATEFPYSRQYDHVICLSRSGTTTEIIDVLQRLSEDGRPGLLITAVADGPAAQFAADEVVLDFADEQSVVQTRFATSTLAWLRKSLGDNIDQVAADGEEALQIPLLDSWVNADQVTFLGTGWTIGLATEAALKCREAAQFWTEDYAAMEYRHGPISIAQPGRLVWVFGPVPTGLDGDVEKTGAELVTSDLDPMAFLIVAQRLAVAWAEGKGLNPDTPRHLTRSIILE